MSVRLKLSTRKMQQTAVAKDFKMKGRERERRKREGRGRICRCLRNIDDNKNNTSYVVAVERKLLTRRLPFSLSWYRTMPSRICGSWMP